MTNFYLFCWRLPDFNMDALKYQYVEQNWCGVVYTLVTSDLYAPVNVQTGHNDSSSGYNKCKKQTTAGIENVKRTCWLNKWKTFKTRILSSFKMRNKVK